jgi:hypothetical protein
MRVARHDPAAAFALSVLLARLRRSGASPNGPRRRCRASGGRDQGQPCGCSCVGTAGAVFASNRARILPRPWLFKTRGLVYLAFIHVRTVADRGVVDASCCVGPPGEAACRSLYHRAVRRSYG